MHRHPNFELWLHEDNELAAVLGSPISERATIHEWPLSCVQRIRTAAGSSYIYKVQAPPTLEVNFYTHARSELLVPVRLLEEQCGTTAMIMEDVNAPRLNDIHLEETEILEIAADLLKQIAEIGGELPAMADIRTEDRWLAYIKIALDDMRALISEGSFHQVDHELINCLERWSEAPPIMKALNSQTGYVHADLKAENVLVTPNGYRVLDWQRPIRGPVLLDTATLLISLRIDPSRHVPIGIIQLYHFLHIAWFGQAARKWVPQGKSWFDGIIKGISVELKRLQLSDDQ
ncbi:aminoglycoside phosphotransferase family protein [Paenibacillus spongiae]|uniref:Aminoglycoside phosphotransferase family protein n=1 Tax=Paenibacillus spongiae TaxID=2909671 RepID=A0ABY5SAE1_9BACL|nr:aminoglycoside phosphotransferase family protein [Paenibacillus spongiae]UVI29263.1 aminoglycoside phosphotransferase family protein [Paenibacillus spongiae]